MKKFLKIIITFKKAHTHTHTNVTHKVNLEIYTLAYKLLTI